MSWIEALERALHDRRVPVRERRRIVAELTDHIACEPGCEERLGDPAELATTFADELATSGTKHSTAVAFGALALTAAALVGSQMALGARSAGYPGYRSGHSAVLALVAIAGLVLASQAALVAGCLAALQAIRRRHARTLPAAELALMARRTRLALWSGVVTVAGGELYALNFTSRLSLSWLVGSAAAGLLGAAALLAALRRLRRVSAVAVSGTQPAGGIYDDVPLLREIPGLRRPWGLGLAASALAALLVIAATGNAESSLLEGVERGVVEGVAALAGFALFGGALGIRAATSATD